MEGRLEQAVRSQDIKGVETLLSQGAKITVRSIQEVENSAVFFKLLRALPQKAILYK